MWKQSILVLVTLIFSATANNVHATDVGGIIDVNTTWTLANSPYNLTSDVQVADGVTLTVEPAVMVNGQSNRIEIWGMLDVNGTEESRVILNHVSIWARGEAGIIDIKFSEITAGKIRTYGDTFVLQDSILMDAYSPSQGVHIGNGSSYSYIERNIFHHTVDIDTAATNTYIYNNVFFEQTSDCAIIAGDNPVVKYNSFLSTDRIALKLQNSGSMTATENYWNTTDTTVIDSMIYDRNDDLSRANYIIYEPILTEPHPNTPIFLPDQILTIQTEPNDVNTVTPSAGQHICSGLVDISAERFINCPDVYSFDHWEGDVTDPNSANTTIFMDSDKTVTAIFVDDRQCGDECHPYPAGDVNKDCLVNQIDVLMFKNLIDTFIGTIQSNWMECTKPECD